MIERKLSTITASALGAVLLALLLLALTSVTPTTTLAAKGGNSGGGNEINYDVLVVDHTGFWPEPVWPLEGAAGPYVPVGDCPGDTPGSTINYGVAMIDKGDTGDPNACGIVELYDPVIQEGIVTGYAKNGYQLLDAVGFTVSTFKVKGDRFFYSVVLHGQEDTGPDSSWHESREMPLVNDPPLAVPEDPSQPFTLHVHATVPVEIYDSHLDTGGNKPLEVVGWISVGDLKYIPQ